MKSGKDYKIHSALNSCVSNPEYEVKEAFVLSNYDVRVENRIKYLPVYMAMFINNTDDRLILDKIEW